MCARIGRDLKEHDMGLHREKESPGDDPRGATYGHDPDLDCLLRSQNGHYGSKFYSGYTNIGCFFLHQI